MPSCGSSLQRSSARHSHTAGSTGSPNSSKRPDSLSAASMAARSRAPRANASSTSSAALRADSTPAKRSCGSMPARGAIGTARQPPARSWTALATGRRCVRPRPCRGPPFATPSHGGEPRARSPVHRHASLQPRSPAGPGAPTQRGLSPRGSRPQPPSATGRSTPAPTDPKPRAPASTASRSPCASCGTPAALITWATAAVRAAGNAE